MDTTVIVKEGKTEEQANLALLSELKSCSPVKVFCIKEAIKYGDSWIAKAFVEDKSVKKST